MRRRIFISINLEEETKRQIAKKIEPLKKKLPARWTDPNQFHITLGFVGSLDDSVLPELCEKLKEGLSKVEMFEISFGEFVWGPSLSRARMLWLLGSHSSKLDRVRKLAEDALQGVQTNQKRFRPHITVARLIKPHENRKLLSLLRLTSSKLKFLFLLLVLI